MNFLNYIIILSIIFWMCIHAYSFFIGKHEFFCNVLYFCCLLFFSIGTAVSLSITDISFYITVVSFLSVYGYYIFVEKNDRICIGIMLLIMIVYLCM